MSYYTINTDLVSIDDPLFRKSWFDDGFAYTSGDEIYGKKLGKLVPGDTLFCYCRRIGLIAVGEVAGYWDEKRYDHQLYEARGEQGEVYKIRVDWHTNLMEKPIPHNRLVQCGPFSVRGALQQIRNEGTAFKILSLIRIGI